MKIITGTDFNIWLKQWKESKYRESVKELDPIERSKKVAFWLMTQGSGTATLTERQLELTANRILENDQFILEKGGGNHAEADDEGIAGLAKQILGGAGAGAILGTVGALLGVGSVAKEIAFLFKRPKIISAAKKEESIMNNALTKWKRIYDIKKQIAELEGRESPKADYPKWK